MTTPMTLYWPPTPDEVEWLRHLGKDNIPQWVIDQVEEKGGNIDKLLLTGEP